MAATSVTTAAKLESFDPLLTVPNVCALLDISRSTFYHWRQVNKGPECLTLPNGALRVRLSALNDFLARLEVAA